MISLGTWAGTLYDEGVHSGTKNPRINKEHAELNICAREIAEEFFPDAFNCICKVIEALDIDIREDIGGEKGLCHQLVQSGYNFYCESHYDLDLSKYSFAIWNSVDKSDPPGWYFVLPSISGKVEGVKYEGIAIRLRDGVGIEWAGPWCRHCSTSPKKNVLGTYLGVMKP